MQLYHTWKRRCVFNPTTANFHLGYGSLLQRLGRGDEAGPQYEAAARLLPDSPEAHYNYALILASVDKGNDALRELQRRFS